MMMLGVMWMMTAVVVGFMLGRVSMYGQMGAAEDMEGEHSMEEGHNMEERNPGEAHDGKERQAGDRGKLWRRGRGHHQEEGRHWSLGSPVAGIVTEQGEGEHPMVVVDPDCEQVYAPAGGKITRLYPMGNAFRLLTEFGTELYIQIGSGDDELLGRYYRPRILQNEIVTKGKLLLEFDRAGLEAAGSSCQVSIRVEGCGYGGSVKGTAGERVRLGEEIFRVQEAPEQKTPGPERRFLYRVFD